LSNIHKKVEGTRAEIEAVFNETISLQG
jgi:hypothetical protein